MHDTQNLHPDDVIRKRQRKKLHRYPLPKMADDIDNLLREAENVLNLDGSAEPQSNSDKKLHNEVNEMLGLEAKDEEEIPKAISDKQITSSVYSSSSYSKLATPAAANAGGGEEKKKCHHLVLTGTYTAVGKCETERASDKEPGIWG